MTTLQFLASEKGQLKLLVDGYLFFKERQTSKTYWKCEMYQKHKCHVRIITVGDAIESMKGEHTHKADYPRVEAMKTQDAIRKRAKSIEEAPQEIISKTCDGISSDAAEHIPKVGSIRRTIRNVRKRVLTSFAEQDTESSESDKVDSK